MMRSQWEDFGAIMTNGVGGSNVSGDENAQALPYHGRENSQLFSYGQLYNTSTAMRGGSNYKSAVSNQGRDQWDADSAEVNSRKSPLHAYNHCNSGGNSSSSGSGRVIYNYTASNANDSNNGNNNNYSYIDSGISNGQNVKCSSVLVGGAAGTGHGGFNANTIKAQPRLTSPLLVRKTLKNNNNSGIHISSNGINNSRSPMRNPSNTISNTYHYSYNSGGGGGGVRGDGGGGFNETIINKYNANNCNNISDGIDITTTTNIGGNNNNSKYNINNNNNNNNNTTRKTETRYDIEDLLRERREKVYSEYQASTARMQHHNSTASSHMITNSSSPSRYNFDIEFHLNLEDDNNGNNNNNNNHNNNTVDYANGDGSIGIDDSIDGVSHRPAITVGRRSTTMPYHTHDIPLMARSERSYHTIGTPPVGGAVRGTYGRWLRETTTTATATATASNRYGNENPSGGYGCDHDVGGHHIAAADRLNRSAPAVAVLVADDFAPIYAVSTKQKQVASYRGTQQPSSIGRSEPELLLADYTAADSLSPAPPPTGVTLVSRPETPAFPVTPRTPYGTNNGPNASYGHMSASAAAAATTTAIVQRSDAPPRSELAEVHSYGAETIYHQGHSPNARLMSSLSLANSEPQEVAAHLVKFAKDSSKFWYKPTLTREEAIALLLHAPPGTFVVRDSTTYKSAYGLVVRVAQPPPGSMPGRADELVRHFLIEPTTRGVRLKGCANEPVFTSLSAFVYEHSINALALPCALLIPDEDLLPPLVQPTAAQKQLLTQGAACNVLWLFSCDTESLTGEEAIRKAIRQMHAQRPPPSPTEVHFKVSQQGITLTDNTRKKFFRKHYVANMISYCAIDPDHRMWSLASEEANGDGGIGIGATKKTIFAFVARRSPSSQDNQCHVFCDLAINQPASAIVSFANRTLPTERQRNYVL